MIRVPLLALPDQRIQMILGGQDVTLRVYTRDGHLYTDLDVSDTAVWRGFISRNCVPCKLYTHLSFFGQLVFVDMQGTQDPEWQGLGGRWLLVYLTDAEVSALFPERNP
jgi:hypothetical protein